MSESAMPAVFQGRPSRKIGDTPAAEVRRVRGFAEAFWLSMSALIVSCFLVIFFWPLALIGFLVAIHFFIKWVNLLFTSGNGEMKKSQCPSCDRIINFWVSTAFPCPFCKRTLMRHDCFLYDITK